MTQKGYFPDYSAVQNQAGYMFLDCINCGQRFTRRVGQERDRIRRGCRGPFCSGSCASMGRLNNKGGNNKLTAELVAKIRECDRAGIPSKKLCEVFQMSKSAIYDIINYRKWKSVPDNDGIKRSSRPSVRW